MQRNPIKRRSHNVAMFARLVSVNDWEEISVQQQQRLKVNVKEDGAVDYEGIAELVLEPGV